MPAIALGQETEDKATGLAPIHAPVASLPKVTTLSGHLHDSMTVAHQ